MSACIPAERVRRRYQKNANTTAATTAIPPMTPPTIAPTGAEAADFPDDLDSEILLLVLGADVVLDAEDAELTELATPLSGFEVLY